MSDVPEQQNPPLDIPNKVDQAVLEKFGAEDRRRDPRRGGRIHLSPRSLLTLEGSECIAGGVTQNPIRVAQWMLQEKATSYVGSGETDQYAHKIQATCVNDNVACVYMVDENTGTCACCIVDTERSMYVDLKAAIYYKVDHLKEHIAVLEKVSVVYS